MLLLVRLRMPSVIGAAEESDLRMLLQFVRGLFPKYPAYGALAVRLEVALGFRNAR